MISFQKAERKSVKLKIAITGPSGSGKTYSALKLAAGLGKKIALLDTENESASLYAGVEGLPEFDTLIMNPPFLSSKYHAAIDLAVKNGYDVLITDSITHQWNGVGGIIDRIDKQKLANPKLNSYTIWAKYTPEHEDFKSSIIQAPIHIISTMRSKQDYVMQDNGSGKMTPQKVGMAPIQRDQFEYEFTIVFDISMEHYASVSKDRTGLFDGQHFLIDESIGTKIIDWLASGKQPLQPPLSEKPSYPKKIVNETVLKDPFVENKIEEIPHPTIPEDYFPQEQIEQKPRNLALAKYRPANGPIAKYESLAKTPINEAMAWIANVEKHKLKDGVVIPQGVIEDVEAIRSYFGI